jgi:hypothetical protein
VNTEEAFTRASRLLDKANRIWKTEDKPKYSDAEQAYQEAVTIRDQYFNDRNVLTCDQVKM